MNYLRFFRTERSTDQVIKPINLEALAKWVTAIPEDVKRDMATIAPMLGRLGYDPASYPPNYGDPDKFVAENTDEIRHNEDFWRKRGQEIATMTKPKWNPHGNGNNYKDGDDANKDSIAGQDHIVNESENSKLRLEVNNDNIHDSHIIRGESWPRLKQQT